MSFFQELQIKVVEAIFSIYEVNVEARNIVINHTKKEFKGDYTIVTFPLAKILKSNPNKIGEEIGEYIQENLVEVDNFNVTGGFVNFSMTNLFWQRSLQSILSDPWENPKGDQKIMIEYSSPNTNKPLHLGHIRNILLGWSCAKIYDFIGYQVVKTQVVNDRGVAICKSMLAWTNFGDGETPESSGLKSDHLIGKYYVLFNEKLSQEYLEWQNTELAQKIYEQRDEESQDNSQFFKAYANDYFNKYSQLGTDVRSLLIKWENGDQQTVDLWKKMNNWVYEGFETTYKKLEVEFDVSYYESETYLLGKESIEKGLLSNVFYRKDDSSVWVDLEDVGMDQKILLRSDGTSVYMTQDIGTAQRRHAEFQFDKMVYVVGDEQDYHFRVLFEILNRLEESYAKNLFHLSYGMVDLPTGKMKSREGTVVDADILIQEVIDLTTQAAKERGELNDLSVERQNEIIRRIALGALKFFIIKVNPKKRMVYNPEESLDMQGQTGPYIQNAYVRIQSILRKANEVPAIDENYILQNEERELVSTLASFRSVVLQAAKEYDPSSIANYAFNLAKNFHRYYHEYRILNGESESAISFRLNLVNQIGIILEKSFELLGIKMPERM